MQKISRILSLVLALLYLGLCACSTHSGVLAPVVAIDTDASDKRTNKLSVDYHTVKKGDTLYNVATKNHTSVKQIINLNHLKSPYKLRTGQRLQLRVIVLNSGVKVNHKPSLKAVSSQITVQENKKTLAKIEVLPASIKPFSVGENSKAPGIIQWQWPAQGKVVKVYSALPTGNRGIDITNYYGAPVLAAADGKVVYSGSGLTNYGNLIIIKHNNSYLSAYAYNKRLIIKEGQSVKAGQEIAEMGRNAAGDVLLHFEIRRNGKPVNPLNFLKRRDS